MNCPNCNNILNFMESNKKEFSCSIPCPYCSTELWFKVTGSDKKMKLWEIDHYINVAVNYDNFGSYFEIALIQNHINTDDGVIKFNGTNHHNYILNPYKYYIKYKCNGVPIEGEFEIVAFINRDITAYFKFKLIKVDKNKVLYHIVLINSKRDKHFYD